MLTQQVVPLGWEFITLHPLRFKGVVDQVELNGLQYKGGMSVWLLFKTPPTLQPVSFHQPSLRSDGKLSSVAIQPWLPHPIWNSSGKPGKQRRDLLWVCHVEMFFTQMVWIFVFCEIRSVTSGLGFDCICLTLPAYEPTMDCLSLAVNLLTYSVFIKAYKRLLKYTLDLSVQQCSLVLNSLQLFTSLIRGIL